MVNICRNVYENKVIVAENITDEAIEIFNNNYKGQWIQEANAELKAGSVKETGILTVLDTGDEIRFEDNNKNPVFLPDEGIGMSYKMAQLLGVDIGDIISWRIYGQKDWKESKISVLYKTPMG